MIRYQVDGSHSTFGFAIKHLGVATVRGKFTKFEGTFEGPDEDMTAARGEAKIEVASLTTENEQRDAHLRSADFFEADRYPFITFRLTGVEKSAGSYKVRGELTIKDVTRPVVLEAAVEGPVPDPFGGKERLGVTATGNINRMDFGLNWNGVAGAVPVAGHNVKLDIDAAIVVHAADLATAR